MDRDTCLLCFSINVKTFNIKETPLQDVYEEITGFKAQTDPHRLCYNCYAKLQQCYSLVKLTRNIKMSSENENRQVEYPPLVELSKVLNTSTPYHFVATKQEPDVKEDSSYCETGVETMVQPVSIKVEPEVLDTKSDSQLTNEKMKISKRYCSVFGCLNNGCKDSGLSFFCVPTDQRTFHNGPTDKGDGSELPHHKVLRKRRPSLWSGLEESVVQTESQPRCHGSNSTLAPDTLQSRKSKFRKIHYQPSRDEKIVDAISNSGSEISENDSDESHDDGGFSSSEFDDDDTRLQEFTDTKDPLAEPNLLPSTSGKSASLPISSSARKKSFSSARGPTGLFSKPYDAFVAIWPEDFMKYVVTGTNKYAKALLQRGDLQTSSRIVRWQETSVDELYVYFAIILATGFCVKPNIQEYWTRNDVMATPNLAQYMSYNRFVLLNKCINFNNKNSTKVSLKSQADAKLFKIMPLIEHLNYKFQSLYNLDRNIMIVESFIELNGRPDIKESNSSSVGIKTSEVCEARSGYLWRFKVHAGREDKNNAATPSSDVISSLVSELLGGLENKSHVVWLDSYYNSPKQARHLKSRGFDCCAGMLSSNRHALAAIAHQKKKHKNHQLLKTYPIERIRATWYKLFFRRLLNISILNAYILYKNCSPSKRSHCSFRKTLVEEILSHHHRLPKRKKPQIVSKPLAQPRDESICTPEALQHFVEEYGLIPGTARNEKIRRTCVVCHKRGPTYCPACRVPLCAVGCSKSYHTRK